MHVQRRIRTQGNDRVQFMRVHGAQAVWCDAYDGIRQPARMMLGRLEQAYEAIEAADEAPLAW
jgi:hypothetical protein